MTLPPDPRGVETVEALIARLRALQAWADVPFREIQRRVVRSRVAREVPERPALSTVYRCFQAGRSRLDTELVVDIARALVGDEMAVDAWRHACEVVAGRMTAAAVVEVADRWPQDLDVFVGRQAELGRIMRLAEASAGGARVVVIEGMAGVGKTCLAVRAGNAVLRGGRCADLVLAVDLRGYDHERPPADPAAVLEGFLRRLGVPGDQIQHLDLAGRAARYRELTAGLAAVLLLDNAADAEQVRPLLPPDSGSLVLVTSRRALAGLRGSTRLPLEVFTREDAVALLRRVAGEERIGADLETATRIAGLLACLPLALSLVAARIRLTAGWTLLDHWDRLVQRQASGRLEEGVEVAFGLSYQELAEDRRRTLKLLALHPGDEVEAHATAAMADLDVDDAREHLATLLAGNLLQQVVPGRYRFHDLIRLYALDRARDEQSARDRHTAFTRLLDHYVGVAAVAMDLYAPHEKGRRPPVSPPRAPAPRIADAVAAVAWLDTERPNLLAVALHAADHGWPTHAGHLSMILGRYLLAAGAYRDAQTLHARALRHADPLDAAAELTNLGRVYWHQGRYPQALDHCQRAAAAAQVGGDRRGEQRARSALGAICFSMGHYDDALQQCQLALGLSRELGDRAAEEAAIGNLGKVHWGFGRYADAIACYQQALAIAAELGDRTGEGIAHSNLGQVYTRLGQHDRALDHHRRALQLHRDLGNRTNEHTALDRLGELCTHLGLYDDALAYHRQALALAREIGNRNSEVHVLDNLGTAFALLRRHDDALDHYERALALAREIGNPTDECHTLNNLGRLCTQQGQHGDAVDRHRQALALAEHVGNPYEQSQAHTGIAQALTGSGDDQAAHLHRRRAARLIDALGADIHHAGLT